MTTDLVERLRSNEPLPVCPFDKLSPHYLTMPDDKPCPICGQENTLKGPDKCRGADTRIMKEAADEIECLRAATRRALALADERAKDANGMIEEIARYLDHEGHGIPAEKVRAKFSQLPAYIPNTDPTFIGVVGLPDDVCSVSLIAPADGEQIPKSAPVRTAPQNTAEREPSVMPACAGADTAADGKQAGEAVAWTNASQLGFLTMPDFEQIPMAIWAKKSEMSPIALYAAPPAPQAAMREAAEPIPIEWCRPRGETFEQMRTNVWADGLAQKGDTILIWVNEGDFWHACITCGSKEHRAALSASESQSAGTTESKP